MIKIDQSILDQQANKKRIAELKQLLAESDFRMSIDVYNSMTPEQQSAWTSQRLTWKMEIRQLEQ